MYVTSWVILGTVDTNEICKRVFFDVSSEMIQLGTSSQGEKIKNKNKEDILQQCNSYYPK